MTMTGNEILFVVLGMLFGGMVGFFACALMMAAKIADYEDRR